MIKGRYVNPKKNKRRRANSSAQILPILHNVGLKATIDYGGKVHEIRIVDISEHGILIPKRIIPPLEGTHVKVHLTIKDVTSTFEGVVKRMTKCHRDGIETFDVGIEFPSSEYRDFFKDKILIA